MAADPQPQVQALMPGTGEGSEQPAEKVPPLIPARTTYDRTIEEVARSKALPDLEWAMGAVRSVSAYVYVDPRVVADSISKPVAAKGSDGQALARLVAERPEQFGQLRGKIGLLRENKELKAARHYAKALSHHVEAATRTWERRVEAERKSELWKRERQDVVEVPGLTARSQELLRQLDQTPWEEKDAFLNKLVATPEGRQALEEAKTLTGALMRRFGSSDPRDLEKLKERLDPTLGHCWEKIIDIARLTQRARTQDLVHHYRLDQSLRRGRKQDLKM